MGVWGEGGVEGVGAREGRWWLRSRVCGGGVSLSPQSLLAGPYVAPLSTVTDI